MGSINASRYDFTRPVAPARGTDKRLSALEHLFWKGTLSSVMLHELVAPHTRRDDTNKMLRGLKSVPNRFVKLNLTQKENDGHLYKPSLFDITSKGINFLLERDIVDADQVRFRKMVFSQRRDFFHDSTASFIVSDISLGAKDNFIHMYDAISKGKNLNLEKPLTIDDNTPDGFFGIKYINGYRFFVLEYETGHKPNTRSAAGSRFDTKIASWCDILRTGKYKSAYGTPNLIVLVATPTERKTVGKMKLIKDTIGKRGCVDAILFGTIPLARDRLNPTGELFGKWETINGGFDISKP